MDYHKLTLVRNCCLFLIVLFSLSGKLYAQSGGPVAKVSISNSTFCSGGCVDFTDLSTGNPTSWFWQFPGSDSASSFVQNPTHICYPTPGTYSVTLTISNANGTGNYNGHNVITVIDCNKPPVANFTMSDSSFCVGKCINFFDKSTGATSWAWTFQGADSSSSFSRNPTNICFNTVGSYTIKLTVSNDAGSDTRQRFQIINVQSCIPVASFIPSINNICPGQCVNFNNTSTNAVKYLWVFNNNPSDTSGSMTPPTQCYDSSGRHMVELIAYSATGAFAIDTMSINVLDCSSVAVPTAFSPNGDNNDDVLRVLGDKIKTMNFQIYNRWGQLVFQSQDRSTGWDGTYKGVKQPVGVYEYHLDATLLDGTSIKKKGNITLLR